MNRLLIVDLDYPNRTHYHSPETIDSFYWGRDISKCVPVLVKTDGTLEQIILTSADIVEIKTQILSKLNE